MWTGDPPANARGFQPFWQAKKAFIRVQNLCDTKICYYNFNI